MQSCPGGEAVLAVGLEPFDDESEMEGAKSRATLMSKDEYESGFTNEQRTRTELFAAILSCKPLNPSRAPYVLHR